MKKIAIILIVLLALPLSGFCKKEKKEKNPLFIISKKGTMHKYGDCAEYITEKDKWGFMNRKGRVVIPLKYDFVNAYSWDDD